MNAKACMGDTGRSLALLYGHMKIVSMIDNHNVPAHSVRAEPGEMLLLVRGYRLQFDRQPLYPSHSVRSEPGEMLLLVRDCR